MVTNHLVRDDMKTPEDVAVLMRLHELGWGKKRIAREMGISKGTVARYLRQGGYKPYRQLSVPPCLPLKIIDLPFGARL